MRGLKKETLLNSPEDIRLQGSTKPLLPKKTFI